MADSPSSATYTPPAEPTPDIEWRATPPTPSAPTKPNEGDGNVQLQVLGARVKTMERTVASNSRLQQINAAATAVGLSTMSAETYAAYNPLIAALIAAPGGAISEIINAALDSLSTDEHTYYQSDAIGSKDTPAYTGALDLGTPESDSQNRLAEPTTQSIVISL